MSKLFALSMLCGACVPLLAAGVVTSPEIDAATGVSAVVLLAGAVLIVRGRRKKSAISKTD